jgi:hypothetical protein
VTCNFANGQTTSTQSNTILAGNGYTACSLNVSAAAVPGTAYTLTATVAGSSGNISSSIIVNTGAALSSTTVLTVDSPDVPINTIGLIKATLKDANGKAIGDGQALTATVTCGTFLAVGTGASTVSTTNGVSTFTYISPGTPCLVTLNVFGALATNSSIAVIKTQTFNVTGTAASATPTEPGAIGAGGLLCFNYSGPTKAVADFATYFAAGVDGINVQTSTGSFNSWFRALPTAATQTTLTTGDRVCAGGTSTKIFA